MYVHVRQHPSVSWWVRRNEINTIPLVALAGVETEATISPWTAVAHRHPNLGDSVHSHTLPSLVPTGHSFGSKAVSRNGRSCSPRLNRDRSFGN
jgi:hypothetical protein